MRKQLHVGFTGTSQEISIQQFTDLSAVMLWLSTGYDSQDIVLHHGDCVNADAIAHNMAVGLGWSVVKHPSTLSHKRAYTSGGETREAKPPLKRNRDIVDETQILIAVPAQRKEVLRSGTWSTVRYARTKRRPIMLVLKHKGEQ